MQEHQTVKAKVKVTKPIIGVKRTVLGVREQFQVFSKVKGTRLYNLLTILKNHSYFFVTDMRYYLRKKSTLKNTSKLSTKTVQGSTYLTMLQNMETLTPNTYRRPQNRRELTTSQLKSEFSLQNMSFSPLQIQGLLVTPKGYITNCYIRQLFSNQQPKSFSFTLNQACVMAKLLLKQMNKKCYYFR